jgi:hypothetical protein
MRKVRPLPDALHDTTLSWRRPASGSVFYSLGAASASSEKIKGQYGVAAGLDAGSHIVPLAVSWAAGNESTETWLCLVEPVADYYGEVVKSRVAVWVADADKGGAAALKQTFPESGILICSQHRSETAAGKFGKGSKVRPFNVKLSRRLARYPQFRRCTSIGSTRRRHRRSAWPTTR